MRGSHPTDPIILGDHISSPLSFSMLLQNSLGFAGQQKHVAFQWLSVEAALWRTGWQNPGELWTSADNTAGMETWDVAKDKAKWWPCPGDTARTT